MSQILFGFGFGIAVCLGGQSLASLWKRRQRVSYVALSVPSDLSPYSLVRSMMEAEDGVLWPALYTVVVHPEELAGAKKIVSAVKDVMVQPIEVKADNSLDRDAWQLEIRWFRRGLQYDRSIFSPGA